MIETEQRTGMRTHHMQGCYGSGFRDFCGFRKFRGFDADLFIKFVQVWIWRRFVQHHFEIPKIVKINDAIK